MTNDKSMPLMGHLAELRRRLLRSTIALVITTILSLVFSKQIFEILTFKSPLVKPVFDFLAVRFNLSLPPVLNLTAFELTERLGIYMKVCLAAGIILAMPYLIYEIVMFVSPALTPQQRRRFIYLALPWVGLMFLAGVVFAYFILLPPALRFLTTFGGDIATLQGPRIGNYISTVSRLLLGVGLVFELPVLLTLLAQMGIVSSKGLAGKRKIAGIGAFIVGAAITPTFDPVNQTLVALPLFVLYEVSIWLARLVELRKRRVADSKPAGTS